MIQKIVLFTFLIVHAFSYAQQKVEVYGKILSSDNQPAVGVTVSLKSLEKVSFTDAGGNYSFTHLDTGKYLLNVTGVGVKSLTRQIEVQKYGRVAIPTIYLPENRASLEEVNIFGSRNAYTRKVSPYVAKMPLRNLENSQSYTVITKELLQSQVNINFDDALSNVSGVDQLWGATGRPGDGAAYYTLRGFTTQVAMVNGIVSVGSTSPDPINLETIEVIKGPSSSLYGGAAIGFGGLINNVTKRPLDTLGGRVNYVFGSFDQHRVTADIYGPLSKNHKLLGRVTTAFSNTGTFQDAGFKRSFFIAPSLLYRANERLDIQLDAEIFQSKGTNPLLVFLNRRRDLFARNPSELQFDFHKSYTNDDVTFKNPVSNIRGNVHYKLDDHWTSNTTVSYNRRKSDGYFQYVMYVENDNDTLISRNAGNQNYVANVVNAQQNFVGDYLIGSLRNRTLIGVDFLYQKDVTHNSPYILIDKINTSYDDPAYYQFNRAAIDKAIGASTGARVNNNTRNSVLGAYISNVLDVTPNLHLHLAMRVDHFNNKGSYDYDADTTRGVFSQTAFSPRVGLVYELIKDRISFFGNYQNGFRNVAPVVQPLPDISGNFKPQQAEQLEAGVKFNLFDDRIALTASYYDISVSNTIRPESIVRDGQTYSISVQDGERLSRGFELDLAASPIDGLDIIVGYSHNYSKMVKADPSVDGLRPTEAGPKSLFNLWANYTVKRGTLKGIGVGAGLNYAGENMITNSVPTGAFTIPAYTLVNASVSYKHRNYELALKANNLTDETYFKGWSTVNPMMPRNILGSVAYNF